jgi:hypothetical protein
MTTRKKARSRRVRDRRVVQADAHLAVLTALVAESVFDLGHAARRGAGEVVAEP